MRLSKSQFIRGLQCMKSLWLLKNKPELRTLPDEAQQKIFDTGKDVGILAQQLYPGGTEIVFDYKKINKNIKITQGLIENGIKTIYEATFLYDDVLVIVDILHLGDNGWELYEVKSSTSFKPVNENDISIQYYVLEGSGIKLDKVSLVHINNKYCRKGNLDVGELFKKVDLTETAISNQEFAATEIDRMKNKAAKGQPEPSIGIGLHCYDPYECDFKNYCWKHIPEKSVFTLTGMRKKKKFELYNNGIISFPDIPNGCSLTNAQQIQIQAELQGSDFIDLDEIKQFLENLIEPIGFLDFETFQQAVPDFDNQHPYEQVPFQYSLHILKNSKLKHYEFLGEPGKDPRGKFISQLLNDTSNLESIVVYNMGFEKRILNSLAKIFPEYKSEITNITSRILDLMIPFRSKAYYMASMEGSYSIKKVLPALVPELSYDGMDIGDGMAAMRSYGALGNMTDNKKIENIKNALLEYCCMDTLAMVKILEKLKNLY
jgi:hypothetical protein